MNRATPPARVRQERPRASPHHRWGVHRCAATEIWSGSEPIELGLAFQHFQFQRPWAQLQIRDNFIDRLRAGARHDLSVAFRFELEPAQFVKCALSTLPLPKFISTPM